MEIKAITGAATELETDALVILAYEGEKPAGAEDPRTGELLSSGEFTGKALEIAVLHGPSGFKAKRLVLLGLGKKDKFDAAVMRSAAGMAVRTLKNKGVRKVVFDMSGSASEKAVSAAVEGAILGDFEPDQFKSQPERSTKHLDVLEFFSASSQAVNAGRILGEAQNFSRGLANEPANVLTPLVLADRARELAAESGLEIEVLDQDRMRQLGMGALLGVAQGSAEPPALIVVRYRPEGNGDQRQDHLALVGKGVTFDTGGISIKPSDGMEKMKYDMAGGAAVLGAMRAIARLKPAIPVTAFVPTVENMPGSKAQRPGDIVTSLSGKTVEVLNTDAEGRLILIDALTYAQQLGCTHLVDAATLTGAIAVALGHVRVGAFSNNDQFLKRIMDASEIEGERFWRMPLDDDFRDDLKSAFADLQNIGPRWGGASTAAMFLREFVGETPWVHLDIAGTAWLDAEKPYMAKGPTGVAVRTFVRLALDWQ